MSRMSDLQAEYGLLAALMADPGLYDRVADILVESDFASESNRDIFAAITTLIVSCKPVDIVTVHSELSSRGSSVTMARLNEIFGAGFTSRSMKRYAESIRVAALERGFAAAIDEADAIVSSEGALDERIERVATLFSGLAHRGARRMPKPMHELLTSRIDYYTALSQGEIEGGWPTRLPALDRMLGGGLRPGKVYVIAARPKVGKSSLSQQIAMTLAADGKPALLLSQEMGESELVDRAIANAGRVEYGSLMTGQITNEGWGRLCEGVEKLSKLPVSIDDQGGLSLADIRSKARNVKGLRVLAIDYLQLCAGTEKAGANRNAEIEELSRGIKALAKEMDIAVLLLSQLNRKVEDRADKKPHLGDLRDSGAIEQDADAVIFLWPVKDFEEEGHRLIGCAVAANRSGACGEFALDFRGAHQLWTESSLPLRMADPVTNIARGRKGFEG